MRSRIKTSPPTTTPAQTRPTPATRRTPAPTQAPPSYQEALRPNDGFNTPRYTPRDQSSRGASPSRQSSLETPTSSNRTSSRSRRNSSESSIAPGPGQKQSAKTELGARQIVEESWTPVVGIHYFDGHIPHMSPGGIAYRPYVAKPNQTRGEAIEQRKLESFWIQEMGADAPFPGNARDILKEEVAFQAGYGGPAAVPKGKLSTIGKITQSLSKGKSRTMTEDLAAVKQRYEPAVGLVYYEGTPEISSRGRIAFQAYEPSANPTKADAIKQRKLEKVWLQLMANQPFPANAREILHDENQYRLHMYGEKPVKLP